MKNLEIQINDAIRCHEEIEFMNDYCYYLFHRKANITEIDHTLDVFNEQYNSHGQLEIAKYNALVLYTNKMYHLYENIRK